VHLLGPVSGASDAIRRLTGDLHENLAEADGFALFATQVIDGFIARTGMDVPPAENEPPMRDGFAAASVRELDLAAAGITSVVRATGYRHDFDPIRFHIFEQDGHPIQREGVTAVPGPTSSARARAKSALRRLTCGDGGR
jgi:putative flavoprotein involved in K+ transport